MAIFDFSFFDRFRSKAGSVDEQRATMWTTPWAWRDVGGLWVGHNDEKWLYRELAVAPFTWEDGGTRIDMGSPMARVLEELGRTSQDLGTGLKTFSQNREFHLVAVTFETQAQAPDGTPEPLRDYLDETLQFLVPRKALLLGVKLRPSVLDAAKSSSRAGKKGIASLFDSLGAIFTRALGDDAPDLGLYEQDRARIEGLLRDVGKVPDREVMDQLESWYNLGRGPDALIYESESCLYVGDDRIELAAVMRFDDMVLQAPNSPWLLDAATHEAGPSVISIRGSLEPTGVTVNRARRSTRRMLDQIEQESRSKDLDRPENTESFHKLREFEQFLASGREPMVTDCSIVMARRVGPEVAETYIDELSNSYGIRLKPLEMRQLDALEETLPCSSKRTNPFLQDVSISMLAHAGLQGFAALGDSTGVYLGMVDPDYTLAFLNPLGAPRANKPPAMLIAGDPGSGKSQPLDALVLTLNGYRPMGEIVVGDEVIGSNGRATKVLAVYPQGLRPIYRVRFNDGSSVECDEEHLWAVRTSSDAARGRPFRPITTTQLAGDLHDTDGKRKWRIPMVAPVEFPLADLPLDPYLLGTLLGEQCAPLEQLLGVGDRGLAHKSERSWLSPAYLLGSVAQRTDLLQGLMDTGGWVDAKNVLAFKTSSPEVADGFIQLVESLGGNARASTKVPTSTRHGESRVGRVAHHITVRLPNDVIPFRLDALRAWEQARSPRPTRIMSSVEFVGEKPAQCILVDADDHLYVTEHGLVTHNTFLMQSICLQTALAGMQTIFINPKTDDDLSAFANLLEERHPGSTEIITMSQLEAEGGAFDPFRYAPPEIAAEIAGQHILSVLGDVGYAGGGIDTEGQIMLRNGLKRGALGGARCVADALSYIEDEKIKHLILSAAEGDSLFGLGIGMTPREPFRSGGRLTLIQFDRFLDFPEKGIGPQNYGHSQKVAIAAMRLVVQASNAILARGSGGIIAVDEAWTFLSSAEGVGIFQRLGRLGRSQNILPIFASQRVDDLLREDVAMEGFISRVMVMKLSEEKEARAALKFCGLEASDARISWLREAGPKKADEFGPAQAALALHRDLRGRHAAIVIAPTLPAVYEALTTNPEERRERQEREKALRHEEAAFPGMEAEPPVTNLGDLFGGDESVESAPDRMAPDRTGPYRAASNGPGTVGNSQGGWASPEEIPGPSKGARRADGTAQAPSRPSLP